MELVAAGINGGLEKVGEKEEEAMELGEKWMETGRKNCRECETCEINWIKL
jgi:hypothetical protein